MPKMYPPGFSPEEIAARKAHNPKEIVDMLTRIAFEVSACNQMIEEKTKHLQELSADWKPEYYDDYLKTVYELTDLFDRLGVMTDISNQIKILHCY